MFPLKNGDVHPKAVVIKLKVQIYIYKEKYVQYPSKLVRKRDLT